MKYAKSDFRSSYESDLEEEIKKAAEVAGVTEVEAIETLRIYFKILKKYADDPRLPEIQIPLFGKIETDVSDIDRYLKDKYKALTYVKDKLYDQSIIDKTALMVRDAVTWLWPIRRRRQLEDDIRIDAIWLNAEKEKRVKERKGKQYNIWKRIRPQEYRNNIYKLQLKNDNRTENRDSEREGPVFERGSD